MSIAVMKWAWDQDIEPATKLVLLKLADQSNDDGYCWPSQRTLLPQLGMSESTLRRRIRDLEELGLLRVEHRPNKSNVYWLGQSGSVTAVTAEPSEREKTLSLELGGSSGSGGLLSLGVTARKPDHVWDAFERHFGTPVAKSEQKDRGGVVKEAKQALLAEGIDPRDEQAVRDRIADLVSEAKQQGWTTPFGPHALLKNWGLLTLRTRRRANVTAPRNGR